MTPRPPLRLPESVRELGDRIAQWRASRPHICAMPAELWQEAAELARAHGIYAISRALHVSYGSLREKVEGASPKRRAQDSAPRFVELPGGAEILGMAPTGTVVEITNRFGDKLSIRLAAQTKLDIGGLAAAFIGGRT